MGGVGAVCYTTWIAIVTHTDCVLRDPAIKVLPHHKLAIRDVL